MFVKNHLQVGVVSLSEECIMIKLQCLPSLTIISCYIAPNDSPYHTYAPITEIKEKMQGSPDENYLILGDMNARFGNSRTEFLDGKALRAGTGYLPSPDPIATPNPNARYLTAALKPLLLINCLHSNQFSFPSALTFRQGNRWISELDVCFISPNLTEAVAAFTIERTKKLPSDHAPVGIRLLRSRILPQRFVIEDLSRRARALGARDVGIEDRAQAYRRPIQMREIDDQRLIATLRSTEPPHIESLSIDEAAAAINNTLYSCAEDSKRRTQGGDVASNQENRQGRAPDRWSLLLEGDDHRALWKAINWKGCIAQDDANRSNPDDEEFRIHFEDLLKRDDTAPPSTEGIEAAPYIPLTDDPIQPAEVLNATQKLKTSKAGGPSGVAPGVIKSCPLGWLMMLANFFTVLLSTGLYPAEWTMSKLVTIYKKGPRENCDNYRGISLMDSIGKLYDSILTNRLQQ